MSAKINNQKIKRALFLCMAGMFLLNGMTSQAKESQEVNIANVESEQSAEEVKATEEIQSVEVAQKVQPTELDFGDYQTEMTVGENQLLTITILPA